MIINSSRLKRNYFLKVTITGKNNHIRFPLCICACSWVFKMKQAGAELCQAQYLLELVKLCFGLQKLIYTSSVPSLKIDCLVRTGTITADIFTVPVHMLHGQMLHGQMLH